MTGIRQHDEFFYDGVRYYTQEQLDAAVREATNTGYLNGVATSHSNAVSEERLRIRKAVAKMTAGRTRMDSGYKGYGEDTIAAHNAYIDCVQDVLAVIDGEGTRVSERLAFLVHGTPAPQGSKKFYGGRTVEASKKVGPWREAVVSEILRHGCGDKHLDGALMVQIVFMLERPKAHYGRKGGEPYLRDDAPRWVSSTPDLDKLVRSTFDAMTQSGLIADDARIALLMTEKRYCTEDESPGAFIKVGPVLASPL